MAISSKPEISYDPIEGGGGGGSSSTSTYKYTTDAKFSPGKYFRQNTDLKEKVAYNPSLNTVSLIGFNDFNFTKLPDVPWATASITDNIFNLGFKNSGSNPKFIAPGYMPMYNTGNKIFEVSVPAGSIYEYSHFIITFTGDSLKVERADDSSLYTIVGDKYTVSTIKKADFEGEVIPKRFLVVVQAGGGGGGESSSSSGGGGGGGGAFVAASMDCYSGIEVTLGRPGTGEYNGSNSFANPCLINVYGDSYYIYIDGGHGATKTTQGIGGRVNIREWSNSNTSVMPVSQFNTHNISNLNNCYIYNATNGTSGLSADGSDGVNSISGSIEMYGKNMANSYSVSGSRVGKAGGGGASWFSNGATPPSGHASGNNGPSFGGGGSGAGDKTAFEGNLRGGSGGSARLWILY